MLIIRKKLNRTRWMGAECDVFQLSSELFVKNKAVGGGDGSISQGMLLQSLFIRALSFLRCTNL